jgi:hypothetical protein
VLVKKSPRSLPSDIAAIPPKRRSAFLVVSFTITFILMTIGLLFFSGWQWTSASDWLSGTDHPPAQQEVIEVSPEQVNPAEPAPGTYPTDELPTTELRPEDAAPAQEAPGSSTTPMPASGT